MAFTACATPRAPVASPAAGVVPEQAGTVRQVGSFGYGLVPDADPGTRYMPDALPEELRQDGLRVVFSGTLTPPPEGVRLWGTPLEIRSVRRAD